MKELKIIKFPNQVLKKEVRKVTIKTQNLADTINSMLNLMYKNKGIGLAAPQVGLSLSLLVFDVSAHQNNPEVMLNPIIKEYSELTTNEPEGCLSLPTVWERVVRAKEVTVSYFDQDFKDITRTFTGLEAIVVQHEIDHLKGELIFDQLGALKQKVLGDYMKARKKGFV